MQLSDEGVDNLSEAQFKTLVIRMLTDLAEYGHKLDEKMKAMLSEIKENVQGTNSDGKETSNQKRMKKQEFKKMRRGLGTPRTS